MVASGGIATRPVCRACDRPFASLRPAAVATIVVTIKGKENEMNGHKVRLSLP